MYKYISIISGFSRGSNLDFIRSFCIVFINIITSGIFYQIEKCESWIGIHRSRSIWSYFLLYGRSDTIWTGNAFKLLCVLEREILYKQETERSKNSRHTPFSQKIQQLKYLKVDLNHTPYNSRICRMLRNLSHLNVVYIWNTFHIVYEHPKFFHHLEWTLRKKINFCQLFFYIYGIPTWK